jgi:outer membrane receptor protein involved in Fe transport
VLLASRRLLLAVGLWLVAQAGSALEGRLVVKGTGQPVADAQVSVLGRTGHVPTDAGGRFVLAPTPRAPFEILVRLPGGRTLAPIRVASPPAQPWVLEVAWRVEESVTVAAPAAPGIEGTPASGLALLSAGDVEERKPTNLAQALENVAGASSVSEGQAAVPALRGLSAGRTLILLDGARVSSERRVGPSATYVDPAMLDAVEVARGPGALAYGSDAFGGVIQMRTRRAEPGTPFGGRLDGALGAGSPQQRVSLLLSRGFARGGALVEGHYRSFDDWQSPRGEVPNSGARDQGFLLRFEHLLGGGLFSLGWQSDFGRDIGRPRTNSQQARFYYPREDSHRLTLSWERGGTGRFSRAGVSAFLGSYALVTDQDRHATVAVPRSVERADVEANDFHLRGYAQKALGRARLEAGLDLNGRTNLEALEIREQYDLAGDLVSRSEFVSIADARRVDAALYASLEAPLGRVLSLSGGVRGDLVGTRNQDGYFGDRETDHGAVSGFAALTLGPPGGFSATAQVAHGFRDPTLSDRYYRGPTGRGFITGNPGLDPETSLQLDLALRHSGEGYRVALYAYQYDIQDLIERYQTEADFFYVRNRGEARIRGVEAEAQVGLPWKLSLQATAHLLRGEVVDGAGGVDGIPPPTVTLRLRRDFARAWGWVRVAGYGRLDEPGPTEQARPGYALVDLAVGARLGSRLELGLMGRNLLDEAYLVSPDSRAVLAAGISGVFSLSVRF